MADELLAAARIHDPIGHGYGALGMLAGAVAGAALLAAGVLTGGALFAVMVIAGAALSGGAIARGLQKLTHTSDPTTGEIGTGSPNVHINNIAAVRSVDDTALTCHGLYGVNHFTLPSVPVAEGSETVHINNRHAARVKGRLVCGAKIKAGSNNVWIGGPWPVEPDLDIYDTEEMMQNFLGGVLLVGVAVSGGILVVGTFKAAGLVAAVVAGTGFVAELGAWFVGFEVLGVTGDAVLGEGGGELLQGIGGFGALAWSGRRQQVQRSQQGQPVQQRGGLERNGYRPRPGERSMTREQWRRQNSTQRAERTVQRADRPLENPAPSASTRGHGHADHGHQTTDAQQANRVRTGVTPGGRTGSAAGRASRFESPEAEAEALGRARRALDRQLASESATGAPPNVDPVTGQPRRIPVTVPTNRPGGYGTSQVVQRAPAPSTAIAPDASGARVPVTSTTPLPNARVVWEYVPSTGEWHPVTYFPEPLPLPNGQPNLR